MEKLGYKEFCAMVSLEEVLKRFPWALSCKPELEVLVKHSDTFAMVETIENEYGKRQFNATIFTSDPIRDGSSRLLISENGQDFWFHFALNRIVEENRNAAMWPNFVFGSDANLIEVKREVK